ncbi:MAG: EF-P lysine aminoacylase GenX [Magnetococcales bacterium]|nr:EF-P lysine aminoacylase GenX [Magnetococcales bacterium]
MDSWRPVATLQGLSVRAKTLRQIREFFTERDVLEVETPLLSRTAVPDETIQPMACGGGYLSTSPETAMKRLLAAGYGSIYQIARAFRHEESGPLHNPEFTMLEWYRPGWSWRELMDETILLVKSILGPKPVYEYTFQQAFLKYAGVDPFTAKDETLIQALPSPPPPDLDRFGLLDLLLSQRVEPAFKATGALVLLTHFPVERAAMARIDPGPPATALRFELYADGVELVNGYQELTVAQEQEDRFNRVNQKFLQEGKAMIPIDRHFLAALQAGLPPCAGAALGVDRLAMLAMNGKDLSAVLAFPAEIA